MPGRGSEPRVGSVGPGGRMSRQRKRDAVVRLLRGEDLEILSRALGVTAATLTGWQDSFLAAGEATAPTGMDGSGRTPAVDGRAARHLGPRARPPGDGDERGRGLGQRETMGDA